MRNLMKLPVLFLEACLRICSSTPMWEKSLVTEPLGPFTVTILDLIVTVTAVALKGADALTIIGDLQPVFRQNLSHFCFIFFIK